MPDYIATFYFRDAQNGETTRTLKGTFVDFTAANTALTAGIAALAAASGAHLYKTDLKETQDIAGAPGAESVFMQADLLFELSGGIGKKGHWYIPAPVAACFVTGTNNVDITAAQVTNVFDMFATGGDGWTVSDGETGTSLYSGERRYVNSGSTNLPA